MLLHRQLKAEGYQVGKTLVCDYWRDRRRQRAEVYVPLVHRPGEEAQIDFFEVAVDLRGERQQVWKFLLRLMYSGREFAWLYERCDQVAFLDGHVRAFACLGGIPRRCIYDNLTPAVRKIVGAQRELTGRFLALVSHYLFEPCFARRGEGHDKGGVESRGKAIRLQHIVIGTN
jgi:transposase